MTMIEKSRAWIMLRGPGFSLLNSKAIGNECVSQGLRSHCPLARTINHILSTVHTFHVYRQVMWKKLLKEVAEVHCCTQQEYNK